MITATGYADHGCTPITNEQRISAWRERLRAWIAAQDDPLMAEVQIGRQYDKGVALQKALKRRKRFKLRRPAKPKPANVTPIRRRA